MGKTILIAGKDLPASADFAGAFTVAGHNVAVTSAAEGAVKQSGSIHMIPWNRSSSISARSVLVQVENEFGKIDDVMLYFDAGVYAPQFAQFTPEECTRAVDLMISGYQRMAMETLSRFEQRKSDGRLIFIFKPHPTLADIARGSSQYGAAVAPAGPFVSSSLAAFKAFAENVAALTADRPSVETHLIACDDVKSETYTKDSMLGLWLNEYFSMAEKRSGKPNAKQTAQWLRAGSKGFGIFSWLR